MAYNSCTYGSFLSSRDVCKKKLLWGWFHSAEDQTETLAYPQDGKNYICKKLIPSYGRNFPRHNFSNAHVPTCLQMLLIKIHGSIKSVAF